jgi:hypothetical protein
MPHWLVTYDIFRRVLESKPLAIGTDLHAAMREAVDGRSLSRTLRKCVAHKTSKSPYARNECSGLFLASTSGKIYANSRAAITRGMRSRLRSEPRTPPAGPV